ncbi:DUF4873 domain-containing protein [Nocardioides sp. HM23]|uniref:DUF4873 domain-containing protein n=1 Tax=Nocardioides bizhenqiangii TaxID=3095076 RepID=UPI002ACAAE8E|nr:DUF4873 domain-containing protein [Nocardioides sp. HM23]MDZ5622791.1 DUF4873 domain-containing protein [Nocardioides sp. HM23]
MKTVRRRRRHPRGMAWLPPEEESGYDGPAVLHLGDRAFGVTVHLDGHLEPLDGRYHWYGRIERSADVVAAKDGGATTAHLVVADRPPATLRLAEYDPWGHVQVSGTGAPPYPLAAVEVDVPV